MIQVILSMLIGTLKTLVLAAVGAVSALWQA